MKAGKERKGGTEKGEGSKAKRDKDARGGIVLRSGHSVMSYNHREGKTRSNRGRDKQIEGGRMADRLATLYNRGVCARVCVCLRAPHM